MLSLETMNGEGMDRYRRVAFLLWRNAKLAWYMMVVDVEGLEFVFMLMRDGGCFFFVFWLKLVISWQCWNGLRG